MMIHISFSFFIQIASCLEGFPFLRFSLIKGTIKGIFLYAFRLSDFEIFPSVIKFQAILNREQVNETI
jgi:hypothetical protein